MSDFFEPPPEWEPEPPVRYRSPEWAGPPDGTLPGVVPMERVLARSDRAALCVSHLQVYPAGFVLELDARAIHAAAARSQVLFTEDDLPMWPGGDD